MRFWDSSALVPICLDEPRTGAVRDLLEADAQMAVWWASHVECWSAFSRLRREGRLSIDGEERARDILESLGAAWLEIQPTTELRALAGRLLRVHALRSADAFQLAAALTWAGPARGGELVSFDERLDEAARLEGLRVVAS